MNTVFMEETELTERSLRRRAANKGCALRKNGADYTIFRNGAPFVAALDDDECWTLLESL